MAAATDFDFKEVSKAVALNDDDAVDTLCRSGNVDEIEAGAKVLILDERFKYDDKDDIVKVRVQSGKFAHKIRWVIQRKLKVITRGDNYQKAIQDLKNGKVIE